jgi:hypothetical protein
MNTVDRSTAPRFHLVPTQRRPLREPWTGREDGVVRRYHPDYALIHKKLPHRSPRAIQARARKLGLTRKVRLWTALEVARLKRLYSQRRPTAEELVTALPGRTIATITKKAALLGFVRERMAPKLSGEPVIDAVRLHAHEEGMTMRDLDSFAGTRRYFATTPKRVEWRYIAAAVDFLGGRLLPVWDGDEPEPPEVSLPLPQAA